MEVSGIVHILFFFIVILVLTKPLGAYMAMVFEGRGTVSQRFFAPVENVVYRLFMVDVKKEMDWKRYGLAIILFSAFGLLIVYFLQRLQAGLPLNPADLPNTTSDLAFSTASSFTSNTNWQAYGGETTLSYLTQMVGLTVQNFVSASVGIVVVIVLIRGFTRRSTTDLGNFWQDIVRCVLWIMMPMSIVLTILLVSQGVIQNLDAYKNVTTIDGVQQVLAMGPAASQIAIKQLGTNGGGFFNANSAVPFENATPFSNFLEVVAIFLIPAGLTYTFGKMVGDTRQGWAVFAAMSVLFFAAVFVVYASEQRGNPILADIGVNQAYQAGDLASSGGNMEGKEVRNGIADSVIWAVATTDASNGSVNSMHDSYTPIGGLVLMINMQLGEVVFGGTGSGLYGMLIFAIIAVFIAGLMIGRTPEFLGKKIGPFEVKMAIVAFLLPSAFILLFTALATVTTGGKAGPLNVGPHGFSEILYAFTSAGQNNGSAFAGLTANTPFYNTTQGITMLVVRFIPMMAVLALAGALAKKQLVPVSAGTLPTTGPLFVGLLSGVVFVVGGLTFFPSWALGPIVEHFLVNAGVTF